MEDDIYGLSNPLHLAVLRGTVDDVDRLLRSGHSVNERNRYGRTPLHLAAAKGRLPMLQFLIECGADIHCRDDGGDVPLHDATSEVSPEVALMLCDHGADPNVTNHNGLTPLRRASMYRRVGIAKVLLSKGAEMDLFTAAVLCDTDALIRFLDGDPSMIKAHDVLDRGRTLLHVAGAPIVAEWLLDRGAELEARDKHGMTALHSAASRGDREMTELLIVAGANLEAKERNGYTPLHCAMDSDHSIAAATVLLDFCAKPDACTDSGETPLHIGASLGCSLIVRLLLENDANVNIEDRKGLTPLDHCRETRLDQGRQDVERILMEAGAIVGSGESMDEDDW